MPLPLLIPLISAGAGLLQSAIGGVKARKTQKELEGMKSPLYKQNDSIVKYYDEALKRYGVSPTDSSMYKRNMQNIGRNTATGINALNDRRSGIAGVSSILRGANDAALDTAVAAENEKNNRFGQLGAATSMKAGEDRMAFDINEQQPYERKYNLLAQKAGAANQTANAGISNMFSGLQNYSNMQMVNQMYGDNSGGSGGGSSSVNSAGTLVPRNTRFNRYGSLRRN